MQHNLHKISGLRKCLRHIRDINTMPSTILCNGETAAETAHAYVINSNQKRNYHKKQRNIPGHKKKYTSFKTLKKQTLKKTFSNT